MARCPGDCTKVDKSTLTWFKIAEKGLVSGNPSPGKWATDDLIGTCPCKLQSRRRSLRRSSSRER